MAKVTIKNLDRVVRSLEKVFTKTKQNRKLLRQMLVIALTRIRQQTRAGKQLVIIKNKPGPILKQPDLSDGYKKFRKAVNARGGVTQRTGKRVDNKFFRPGVSNLTFTGQLLKSLKGSVNVRAGKISVFPAGSRRGDSMSNKQLAEDLSDRGRDFLGMDEKGAKRIYNVVLKALRRNIKDFNK